MWLPDNIVAAVERTARVYYVDKQLCQEWNAARRPGELRLLTGWCWSERGNQGHYRQGFKTKTVAYRDAFYALIRKEPTPALVRTRLRVVAERRTA